MKVMLEIISSLEHLIKKMREDYIDRALKGGVLGSQCPNLKEGHPIFKWGEIPFSPLPGIPIYQNDLTEPY